MVQCVTLLVNTPAYRDVCYFCKYFHLNIFLLFSPTQITYCNGYPLNKLIKKLEKYQVLITVAFGNSQHLLKPIPSCTQLLDIVFSDSFVTINIKFYIGCNFVSRLPDVEHMSYSNSSYKSKTFSKTLKPFS